MSSPTSPSLKCFGRRTWQWCGQKRHLRNKKHHCWALINPNAYDYDNTSTSGCKHFFENLDLVLSDSCERCVSSIGYLFSTLFQAPQPLNGSATSNTFLQRQPGGHYRSSALLDGHRSSPAWNQGRCCRDKQYRSEETESVLKLQSWIAQCEY